MPLLQGGREVGVRKYVSAVKTDKRLQRYRTLLPGFHTNRSTFDGIVFAVFCRLRLTTDRTQTLSTQT